MSATLLPAGCCCAGPGDIVIASYPYGELVPTIRLYTWDGHSEHITIVGDYTPPDAISSSLSQPPIVARHGRTLRLYYPASGYSVRYRETALPLTEDSVWSNPYPVANGDDYLEWYPPIVAVHSDAAAWELYQTYVPHIGLGHHVIWWQEDGDWQRQVIDYSTADWAEGGCGAQHRLAGSIADIYETWHVRDKLVGRNISLPPLQSYAGRAVFDNVEGETGLATVIAAGGWHDDGGRVGLVAGRAGQRLELLEDEAMDDEMRKAIVPLGIATRRRGPNLRGYYVDLAYIRRYPQDGAIYESIYYRQGTSTGSDIEWGSRHVIWSDAMHEGRSALWYFVGCLRVGSGGPYIIYCTSEGTRRYTLHIAYLIDDTWHEATVGDDVPIEMASMCSAGAGAWLFRSREVSP